MYRIWDSVLRPLSSWLNWTELELTTDRHLLPSLRMYGVYLNFRMHLRYLMINLLKPNDIYIYVVPQR